MNKYLQSLGRVAHVVIQIGALAGQAIAVTSNNGKVNWVNALLAAFQIYMADQARKAPASAQGEPKQ